jgi:hypothetical protein
MASRNSKRISLPVLAVLLPTTIGASAALSADGEVGAMQYGLGQESCRDYLADLATDRNMQQLYDAWLRGYIAVVNEQTPSSTNSTTETNIDDASAWVHKYCERHAGASYSSAVFRFLAYRARAQTRESS